MCSKDDAGVMLDGRDLMRARMRERCFRRAHGRYPESLEELEAFATSAMGCECWQEDAREAARLREERRIPPKERAAREAARAADADAAARASAKAARVRAERFAREAPWSPAVWEALSGVRSDVVPAEGAKHDAGKPRFDLITPEFLEALARVLTKGAEKYGAENWQEVSDFRARYTAALHRHLNAWQRGETIDPESGEPQLAHVAANTMFLLWGDD